MKQLKQFYVLWLYFLIYGIAYHKSQTTETGIKLFLISARETQTTTYSGIEPDETIKSE